MSTPGQCECCGSRPAEAVWTSNGSPHKVCLPCFAKGAPAGREMDAVVAEKVMGFKWDEKRCRECGFPYDPEGVFCRPDDCSMRPRPKVRADAPGQYSTEIAAAWEVVEKLFPNMSYRIRVFRSYSANLFDPQGRCVVEDEKGEIVSAEHRAPLAICRAALLAVTA